LKVLRRSGQPGVSTPAWLAGHGGQEFHQGGFKMYK